MLDARWVGVLYFVMVLVLVLPGAFYLSRKVPMGTKLLWGLVWLSLFVACVILYRYLSPFF
jgi:hypothetical protein